MNYTNLNTVIKVYFSEIRNNQSLSIEDEEKLFSRISKGDMTARTEIFNRMAKLVVAEAKKFTSNPDVLEDLIQEGNIGVLKAIEKFDLTMEFRFSSYARWWIKCMINTFLDGINAVRPVNSDFRMKVNRIRNEYERMYGKEPTEYEILDILEQSGEVVKDVTSLHKIVMERIDFRNSEDEEYSNPEFDRATASVNEYERDVEEDDLKSILKKKMMRLSDREKRCVKMYYGIGIEYPMTMEDIAKLEDLTPERVRQIINCSIKKMQK